MKNNYSRTIILLVAIVIFSIGGKNVIFAQSADDSKRSNLAVYATGTQNDHVLSASLQNVIQNRTITKLTGDGHFRLIERSGEFLKQIQSEQTMQQSGDVADGQIAELGASYGAEKICVVSVTIIDNYLYIAARIVDVSTKTSFESGDAEINNYNSIPLLTKTLEMALAKMLDASSSVTRSYESSETIEQTSYRPTSQQSRNDFKAYKMRLRAEKGTFLAPNSLAYREYRKYRSNLVAGISCVAAGGCITGGLFFVIGILSIPAGVPIMITGGVLLCTMNSHLTKSYAYYINGEPHTATIGIHPYIGGNNTFGAGLTFNF